LIVGDWEDVPKRAGEKRRRRRGKDGEMVAFYLGSTALVPEGLSAALSDGE
jgi:hypothetical protein